MDCVEPLPSTLSDTHGVTQTRGRRTKLLVVLDEPHGDEGKSEGRGLADECETKIKAAHSA